MDVFKGLGVLTGITIGYLLIWKGISIVTHYLFPEMSIMICYILSFISMWFLGILIFLLFKDVDSISKKILKELKNEKRKPRANA